MNTMSLLGDRPVYRAVVPIRGDGGDFGRIAAAFRGGSPRFATVRHESGRSPRFAAVSHDSWLSPRFFGGPSRNGAIAAFLRRSATFCGDRPVNAAVERILRELRAGRAKPSGCYLVQSR
ncbi:hypothetical protein R1sor_021856 [Riccia sorocarpa]|uniref:Cyclic nucleotide-binding domain-containing protein n=1 Tax=Riccia sorocarpa TaxID=122646 RepID=A0ABD3GI70_9MARC